MDTTAASLLVKAFVDALNSHDPGRLLALLSDDYEATDVAEPEPQRGPGGARTSMERYMQAFPDLTITTQDTLLASDGAALVWTACGTHQGAWLHIPASGRRVCVRGMVLLRMHDGRITRATWLWDVAGALRDLKLLPRL